MIKRLQLLNDKLIELNVNNPTELNKQMLIKKVLKEKNCFLKMDIETAYSLLKDLKIPDEEIKDIYFKLIDIEK